MENTTKMSKLIIPGDPEDCEDEFDKYVKINKETGMWWYEFPDFVIGKPKK